MRFTIVGRIGDLDELEATWDEGALTGDPLIAALVDDVILQGRQLHVTPTGPSFDPGIAEWQPAFFTVAEVFDEILSKDGDVPEYPLPEGTVG